VLELCSTMYINVLFVKKNFITALSLNNCSLNNPMHYSLKTCFLGMKIEIEFSIICQVLKIE
jgi:hypothetical protein